MVALVEDLVDMERMEEEEDSMEEPEEDLEVDLVDPVIFLLRPQGLGVGSRLLPWRLQLRSSSGMWVFSRFRRRVEGASADLSLRSCASFARPPSAPCSSSLLSLASHTSSSTTSQQLPWSTSNEDLVELFQTTGTVQEAEVLFENGRSKGSGVVQFATVEEAETAIAKFQSYSYGGESLDGSEVEEGPEPDWGSLCSLSHRTPSRARVQRTLERLLGWRWCCWCSHWPRRRRADGCLSSARFDRRRRGLLHPKRGLGNSIRVP